MKKYRCPHCGKKSITTKMRIHSSFMLGGGSYGYQQAYKVKCPECDGLCEPSCLSTAGRVLRILMGLVAIALIVLVVYLNNSGIINGLFTFPLFALVFVAYAIYNALAQLKMPLIPYSKDFDSEFRPNARVALKSKKYIKPYVVYGLVFKDETTDVHFKETFPDSMVPAMFFPGKKDSLQYEIRVIDRDIVPDEILYDGAKFLVEDTDGLFVTKGTVEISEFGN